MAIVVGHNPKSGHQQADEAFHAADPKEDDDGDKVALAPFRPRTRRTRLVSRILVVLGVLSVLALVVFQRFAPKQVTASPVLRGTAVDAVYATGTVESFERVIVKAKVSGSILELKVREGDHVKKGDLLALIDSPTLRYDLERGKTDLRAANKQAGSNAPQLAALEAQARATEAQLGVARADRDRVERLSEVNSIARAELDRANAQVATLDAQLAAQLAQRRALSIDLGARASGAAFLVDSLAAKVADTEVRAPQAGVVLSRAVDPGELVAAGQMIARIGDISNLLLECQLDEADVAKVQIGSRVAVSLYAFPDRVFHGEVFDIFPDADRLKKTYLTKVRLTDAPPEGLRSGMSAELNVILGEHANVLLGAAEAIDAAGNAWVVRNGHVEKRALKVGLRDLLRVEILSGVDEGDALVVDGADALSEGARVRVTTKLLDDRTKKSSSGGSKMSL